MLIDELHAKKSNSLELPGKMMALAATGTVVPSAVPVLRHFAQHMLSLWHVRSLWLDLLSSPLEFNALRLTDGGGGSGGVGGGRPVFDVAQDEMELGSEWLRRALAEVGAPIDGDARAQARPAATGA
jgi:hypothetical protein